MPVRLNDGTLAALAIRPAPCSAGEKCDPADCGCHAVDRFDLSLTNAGQTVARTSVWAAYGTFDIVPFDLAGGNGDELLIIRALGRSAPPNGLELKILQVEGDRLIELLGAEQIAGNLSGTPMVCGEWRSRVIVEEQARKPRSLLIRNEVIVPDGCRLDEPGRAAALRSERRHLLFARGRYQLK